jgi:hypothetical protein
LASELLGSPVDRRNLSIYNATPDELDGQFDLAFCARCSSTCATSFSRSRYGGFDQAGRWGSWHCMSW